MDRTFGKPPAPPIPVVFIILAGYILSGALMFFPADAMCRNHMSWTDAGAAVTSLAIFGTATLVGVTARRFLFWMLPPLLLLVYYILVTTGPLSVWGVTLTESGKMECVIV